MLSVSGILIQVLIELTRWWRLGLRSTQSLKAENLFLRRSGDESIQQREILLSILSKFFDWRDSLVAVRPKTTIRWRRAGSRLFWPLKSRPGQPPIPQQYKL